MVHFYSKNIMSEQVSGQREIFGGKPMRINDLVAYTGFSKSYIYKKTSRKQQERDGDRKIPVHQPFGKVVFFVKEEIDKWLLGAAPGANLTAEDVSTSLQPKRKNN